MFPILCNNTHHDLVNTKKKTKINSKTGVKYVQS